MSYDIQFGVKVDGMDGYIASFAEPEIDSPTYNLRRMFVACMGWDYRQGDWYNCAEVFPKIRHGQEELSLYPGKYKKYNAPNGWGTVEGAKMCLDSIVDRVGEIVSGDWSGTPIPLEHLWIRW